MAYDITIDQSDMPIASCPLARRSDLAKALAVFKTATWRCMVWMRAPRLPKQLHAVYKL